MRQLPELLVGAALALACSHLEAQPVLRQLDSVRIRENVAQPIGRVGTIAAGARGTLFVSDWTDMRILQVAPNGAIVRTFGSKGAGPGEFQFPADNIAVGDSILLVWDNSLRRLSRFSLATGRYVGSVSSTLRQPKFELNGSELLAGMPDEQAFTSVVSVNATTGAITNPQGVLPDIAHRFPMLIGPLFQMALAVRGQEVWSSFALSQSLFHWTRGAKTGSEFPLAVSKRRGVSTPALEQMVKDPSKAADLVYDRSFPVTMRFIAPDLLAMVTWDPTMVPNAGRFTGPYHLTVVDVKARRICGDFRIPVPIDPVSQVTLSGDTLIAVQQASDSNDEIATAIRRFAIDPRRCQWTALP